MVDNLDLKSVPLLRLFELLNSQSNAVGDAAWKEVHNRRAYSELAAIIAAGQLTRSRGRIRAVSVFSRDRETALIGLEGMLSALRTDRSWESADSILHLLVILRARPVEVLNAIATLRKRFSDAMHLHRLRAAEEALRSGDLRPYTYCDPDRSFGYVGGRFIGVD